MDKFIKIHPVVASYLTENGGISLSEARARKEEIANENAEIRQKVKVNKSEDLYENKMTVGVSGAPAWDRDIPAAFQINKEFFDKIDEYASRYANSAFYMEAMKAHKELLSRIDLLSDEQIGEMFGVVIPERTFSPIECKSVYRSDLSYHAEIAKTVGELILVLSQEGMALVANKVREALALEARVKHVSDFAKDKDSFLQILMRSPKTLKLVTKEVANTFIMEQPSLAYDPKEYREIFDKLQEKHALYQREFNHAMSVIKNALADAEVEFRKEFQKELSKKATADSILSSEIEEALNKIADIRAELKRSAAALRIIE